MLRLETLGGLVLAGDSGTPLPIQRRQLALLGLLSTAGKRGLSRDKIVALLWPESPESKARHALEQLIYSLRQDRDEMLVAGPDPLRINHHALSADVVEFAAAVEQGALAEAVRLYRGPFLDGFYVTGIPEFEEWVAGERGRLAASFRSVLERLAREQSGAGNHDDALASWRRLSAAEPLSGPYALGLMRALLTKGDRVEAWRAGQAHADLLKREMGREPDAAVAQLLAELAARGGRAG